MLLFTSQCLPTRQVLKVILFRRTSRICLYYLNTTLANEQNKFWKEYRSGYKNIFPLATYAIVIRIYFGENTSLVREAAHISVIVTTKSWDYYEITAVNAHFLFPSEITCRVRITVLLLKTLLNFLSKWNPDRRSCKVIRTQVERLKFVLNRKYLFGISWK